MNKIFCLLGFHKWKNVNNMVECCFRCDTMRIKTPQDFLNWDYKIETQANIDVIDQKTNY